MDDETGMSMAIVIARQAIYRGHRGFGCAIFDPYGRLLATAGGTGIDRNPTRHSEMEAIKKACGAIDGLLYGCTIYSTHEPCTMCCGAICHAKLSKVVWGTDRIDLPNLFRKQTYGATSLLLNTSCAPSIVSGVMKDACMDLLKEETPV